MRGQLLHFLLASKALAILLVAKLFLTIKLLLPLNLGMAATFPPFSRLTQIDLRQASVDLTSAQLLALVASPVTLVAAPGVGYQIIPYLVLIHFFGGSIAYTDAGGAVSLAAGTSNYPLSANSIFLVTVSPNRRLLTEGFGEVLNTAANPPTSENAPLVIKKITNELAAGNGTARVTVLYMIEPTGS